MNKMKFLKKWRFSKVFLFLALLLNLFGSLLMTQSVKAKQTSYDINHSILGNSSSSSQRSTIPIECSVTSLIEAINLANANPGTDEIILAENCVYQLNTYDNINDNNDLIGLPIIKSEIIIEGKGSFLQSSHDDMRAFEVDTGGKLTLLNINISNFLNSNSGGVILNHGTLIAGNSTFASNAAIKGGVIYNLGKTNLFNTTFYNNKAGG